MTRRTAFIRNDWKKGNSAERLAIDYLLIIWTCHFAETDVDGLFCYIQQAYFDDKKNQIIEQKEPCQTQWNLAQSSDQMVLTVTLSQKR